MKFVISGAFQPPKHLVPLAVAADEAGYEALGFSDHIVPSLSNTATRSCGGIRST